MSKVFDELKLPDNATAAQVKARWRELATTTHPDRGGDAEAFNKLRRAYIAALEVASQPRICGQCGGTGRTSQVVGWSVVKFTCDHCNGRGKISGE